METHISHLLLELKHGLEKSLGSSDLKDESELVMDKLIAIEKTPMTSELITKSGLGNTIASIKEKFSDQSPLVSEKAKNILVLWKTIVKAQKNKPSTKTTTHRTTPSDGTASIEDPTLNFKNEERLSLLNQPRMAVVNIFRNQFKEILPPKAEKIALDIEEELNKKFPYDSVPKIYSSKAKSLSFNLAKNEILRNHIQNNQISADRFTSMTNNELASKSLNLEREKARFECVDGRRLDWLEEHKEEIQKSLGIDPNNKWDYDSGEDQLSEPDHDPPDN